MRWTHRLIKVARIQRSMGSFMGTSTWSLRVKQKCWCVVALHLRRVCCPPLPLNGRCGAAVVEKRFCFIVLHLPPKPSGRGASASVSKSCAFQLFVLTITRWTDGLLMSLPTRCMLLDINDRLGRPRAEEPHGLIGTLGAGVEGDSATRFRALVRRHSIAVPQTFHLATPTFCGSSGRSRIHFCCHTPFCAISSIFVDFTVTVDPCCGAARPHAADDGSGNEWHATLPGPYARKMRSRDNRRNALRSRCKAPFLQGT